MSDVVADSWRRTYELDRRRLLIRSSTIGPFCLLLFLFVAWLVNQRRLADVDLAVLLAVQPMVIPGLDLVVRGVTQLGEPEAATLVAAALSLLALRSRRGDFWVPLVIVVTIAVEVALKTIVLQPQPSEYGATLGGANSFPSGHVARETFLLLVVAARGAPAWMVFGGMALASLSRIYWGDHWASDVVGGLLLGTGAAFTALAVAARLSETKGPSAGHAAG